MLWSGVQLELAFPNQGGRYEGCGIKDPAFSIQHLPSASAATLALGKPDQERRGHTDRVAMSLGQGPGEVKRNSIPRRGLSLSYFGGSS